MLPILKPSLTTYFRKTLLYISTMFAFKMASRLVSKKDELLTRMGDVPGIVVDGLLSRFTETARSTNTYASVPVCSQYGAHCKQGADDASDGDHAADAHVRVVPARRRFLDGHDAHRTRPQHAR